MNDDRNFSPTSHTPAGRRLRLSLRQSFLLVAVACAGVFCFTSFWTRTRDDDDVTYARNNLKRIVIALQQYHSVHRRLPYSDNGPDAALFALRDLIAPAAFECHSQNRGRPGARWDTRLNRLANADVAYLNQASDPPEKARVILACELDGARQLYAAGDGVVRGRRGPRPVSQLLGSWVTEEGFLVASKATFDKWCETHSFGGRWEVTSIGGQPDPIATRFTDGSSVQYVYVDGKLNGCKITTANGRVIDELIDTDRYGRIVGISRSPGK